MSDFDGAVQRPAGPEDTDTGSPVGMAEPGASGLSSGPESAVGMEEASAAGVMETGAGTEPDTLGASGAGSGANTDTVGEAPGLTEDQVLGRAPLPDTEP